MRGFDDEERERIEEELVETGRERLVRYGPAKTNVVDITEPVGIAKSTFYRFFDTKAELYVEIYRREVAEFAEGTRAEIDEADSSREGLEALFRSYAGWLEDNPFVQRMVVQSDYRSFYQDVPDETMEAIQREGLAEFEAVFEPLREREGGLREDVETIELLGLLSLIGLLVIHREEYDNYNASYYERVRDLLIETLARGLVG
ncbi:TetR/AcrR family transcriptional regulator [Halalkalicoccus jeotgali]|uniref:Transcription regulator n=1 Tax=Halalkalicoccus jeotgali (strain DSM 18796 / CECT 7217 / JCM 14584 / KCTC 4019 / B3) TaxID=795797 RepID=D8J2P4_HALJB|nr:TetR/AcrR family transcriptional regulator [Halalkalicoccus jeotgali]ADJ15001.1 transcription regulator [Halalkalicoccus jeotgali B3]ELY34983.1 transcriptional regulator [Halalkalicoccus jeotgali B3]